jgi:uncharacterized OB-fold protein
MIMKVLIMGFDEFGVISFVPYTKVSEFPTYLKDGIFNGMKCKNCDIFYFPPRSDCPECLGKDMEWMETKGTGTLITYTTIHAAPTGFESLVPYTIGLLELPEGGRVLAWLEGIEESEIEIGMKLKAVPKKLENDRITYQLEKC